MLRNFCPFVDYKKMIELQANNKTYRISRNSKNNKIMNQQIESSKSKKLRKHQ